MYGYGGLFGGRKMYGILYTLYGKCNMMQYRRHGAHTKPLLVGDPSLDWKMTKNWSKQNPAATYIR